MTSTMSGLGREYDQLYSVILLPALLTYHSTSSQLGTSIDSQPAKAEQDEDKERSKLENVCRYSYLDPRLPQRRLSRRIL